MPPDAEEVGRKHRIDELHTAYPFYGSRRIAAQLGRALALRIYPYLLGSVTSAFPDHVWDIDITLHPPAGLLDVLGGRR